MTMAFALLGVLGAAGSAHATNHWSYILPATCTPTPSGPGDPKVVATQDGALFMYTNWTKSILCPIQLPQSASIDHVRVFANPNGVAHSVSMDLRRKNYLSPTESIPIGGVWDNPTADLGWYNSASPINEVIDNENNAYYLRIQTSNPAYIVPFLIEITYTTP
jgi:hypothetical protein